ncbi:MAG: arginine--tRNA ligase [Candidatus Peregrinibacteria bacterium]|nr:arginine--tRNA ligase [Candidatus Peregrinibacteria bacterium]MCB9808308.1 arginine--tRNA ligase [Candidatus Peribacteria bacterium]
MFSSLTTTVQKSLTDAYGISDITVAWERPQDSAHGDIATPVAMQIAKQVGKSPKDIAETICSALSSLDAIENVEIAGPGYINIWLGPSALIDELSQTADSVLPIPRRKEDPVIVEYSQPNIAKPLGAHHLLTTLIGQSIANIYEHLGFNTVKWNYIGDWGTQFGKLAVAVERWGDKKEPSQYSIDELLALYVRFHEEVENDATLEDEARSAFKRLEEGDAALTAFWEAVVSTTKASLSDVYEALHVSFDLDYGESFYQDKMEPLLQEGIEKHVFVEGEGGSLIVQFPEGTNMPPYLVRKGDGATLYSTRDIAQMRYRIDTYHPKEVLIVTDIAQKLHFEQLEETCKQLQWTLPSFTNVLTGRMRFADKSMSTRKGNVLKLEDILMEATQRAEKKIAEHGDTIQTDNPAELARIMGIGAVSYGILSQNRKQDIVFDWEKMLSFDGNSAPYIQYTHARARSVVEKAGGVSGAVSASELSEKERVLINTLLRFPRALDDARIAHMPHILANFLYQLCQDFNAFYNDEPILKASEPQRGLRVYLTDLTAQVLKTGASLLTISVPDRM